MKKLLLLLLPVLVFACTDYTEDFNTINGRLDNLEQALPSINEQITSINAQLASLKDIDNDIKEQIAVLEKNGNTTATEISNLKAKDSALENSISNLQKYVDTQIQNAKSEAAAAYATIEQYNNILLQLSNLQSSTNKLGEELTAKINAEVKSLNDKISDLENRLKAVEEKVDDLLARIQSVSYIPRYDDNKATLKYISGVSQVVLDFKVSPKECVAELEKVWESAIKIDAVYTETRAVSFVDMPIVEFEADAENGVISVIASGENLSEWLFAGTQSASASLTISDGNSSVTSEYVPMIAQEVDMYQLSVPANQIWYTSTDDNVVEPFNKDGFGAHIVSNTYKNGMGTIVFDAPIASVGESAYYNPITELGAETLKSIALPEGVTTIGGYAFQHCSSLVHIIIPRSLTRVGSVAFYGYGFTSPIQRVDAYDLTDWCKIRFQSDGSNPLRSGGRLYMNGVEVSELTIPSDITTLYHAAFAGCSSITSVTIHENVTQTNAYAFGYCNNLKTVYCESTTPPAISRSSGGYWNGFIRNASGRLIFVPQASVDAYKVADGWSDYADYIVGYDF